MRKAGGKPPAFFRLARCDTFCPAALRLRGPTVMVNLLKLNGYVGRVSEAPPGNILGTEPDVLPGGGGDCYRFTTFSDSVGRVRRSRHPAICWPRKRWPDSSVSLGERARVRGSNAVWSFMLSVASAHIALPVNFLRYVSYGAGSAQGAASRRRPLYPRAPASKIAATRYLRLISAGCGSGRGRVRAKHGPQPASMRAAPAFRERLSDFEAASTGSFSKAGE